MYYINNFLKNGEGSAIDPKPSILREARKLSALGAGSCKKPAPGSPARARGSRVFQMGEVRLKKPTPSALKFAGAKEKPMFRGFYTCFVYAMDHFVSLVKPTYYFSNMFLKGQNKLNENVS